MLDSIRYKENLAQELYILEDESNPNTSKVNTIWPKTILDQVFDPESSNNKTLRDIIKELKEDFENHGILQINFPVTSVNGDTGDVRITKESLGLSNVSNTSDNQKPLSDLQRETILNILNSYNFQSRLNLDDYENHLNNFNNPHHVTIEQIDKNDALKLFVNDLIYIHSASDNLNIHPDIRNSLARLWSHVEESNREFNIRLNDAKELFIKHYDDPLAHMLQFRTKEDIANKVNNINDSNINSIKYPSTIAVDNFIDQKINAFSKTLPNIKNWYDEIITINKRLNLPNAGIEYVHKFYIIKYGDNNQTEIAYCALNQNNFYEWKIYPTGAFSILDNKYIINNTTGITLDISKIANDLIKNEILQNIIYQSVEEKFDELSNILNNQFNESMHEFDNKHYTKLDIDNMHLINQINFLQGIDKGTFRYYINNDRNTMSPDILIRGLQRLAYLEYVTEHEIYDQSIFERHIMSRSLATRHFQEKSILPEFLTARNKNVVLGNYNKTDNSVEEIPFDTFLKEINSAESFKTVIKDIVDNTYNLPTTIAFELYFKISGEDLIVICTNDDLSFNLNNGELFITCKNGSLLFESTDEGIIVTLLDVFLNISNDGNLIVTSVRDNISFALINYDLLVTVYDDNISFERINDSIIMNII